MELHKLTAKKSAEMMEKGEISSLELTRSCLDRIDDVESKIDAFLTITSEQALEQARRSDERRAKGETLGLLDGIPYSIKDNICTKGVRTTCASKMLENFIPPYSATVYERLEQSGAVLLGKLNMDEFAMGSSCEKSYFKPSRNPFDISRVPGGSSGGSSAAVAACEGALSLGTDTSGSIRQPAGLCGIVGLKPTYGAVSRYGLVALASSLDQIGPLGRSVEDVERMFSIISGHDARDATSLSKPLEKTEIQLKGAVFGLPKEYFGDNIEPQTKEKVMQAVKVFEAAGVKFKEVSTPSYNYSLPAYYILSSVEIASNLSRFDGIKYGFRADCDNLDDLYKKSRSEGFGDEVKRRILLGNYMLCDDNYEKYYKKAKLLQRRFAKEFEEVLSDCDILLTPTSPTTAFKLGEKNSSLLKMYNSDNCTVAVNHVGLPALSIPCGMSKDSMTIGMQLIGRHRSDYSLLSVGAQYEEIVGGFEIAQL